MAEKKIHSKGGGMLDATPGSRARGIMIHERLKVWAETRTNNLLADDILEYITFVNSNLDSANRALERALKSKDDSLNTFAEKVISLAKRLKSEDRYIPLCKQYTFQPEIDGWTHCCPDVVKHKRLNLL